MPRIVITREAAGAIRSAATLPFRPEGRQLADGTWEIPLAADTLAALERLQLAGETLSDTIVRVVACSRGPLS